jgi:hypothetical protein
VATGELGAAAAWVGAVAAVRGSDLVASGAADGAVRLWVRALPFPWNAASPVHRWTSE